MSFSFGDVCSKCMVNEHFPFLAPKIDYLC